MEIINLKGREDLLDQMAEIIKDGFYSKFSFILGEGNDFLESVKIIINRDLCYGLLDGDRLKGIAVLKDKSTKAIVYPFKKLRRILGFFRGVKACIMLKLIFNMGTINESTLKLELLSVDKEFRGEGIGHKFLDKIEALAREKFLKKISLEVIDTNPRAKKLYEKFGYKEVKFIYTEKMTRDIGFTGVYEMEKKL